MVAGPTSFAPIIEMAITVVEQSGGQYHVLVIIADGQVFILFCIVILFEKLSEQAVLYYKEIWSFPFLIVHHKEGKSAISKLEL